MTVGKGEFFYVPFRPRSNNRMDRLAPGTHAESLHLTPLNGASCRELVTTASEA